jgi:hypothetical protein
MTLTIEEIPNHPPCVVCGAGPRYLAVVPVDNPARTRGAFPLCNDCSNDDAILHTLGITADSF